MMDIEPRVRNFAERYTAAWCSQNPGNARFRESINRNNTQMLFANARR